MMRLCTVLVVQVFCATTALGQESESQLDALLKRREREIKAAKEHVETLSLKIDKFPEARKNTLKMAYAYQREGEHYVADIVFRAYLDVLKDYTLGMFSILSAEERETMAIDNTKDIRQIQSSIIPHVTPFSTLGDMVCDMELFSKGLLLNFSNNIEQSIINSGGEGIAEVWTELKSLKTFLSKNEWLLRLVESDTTFFAEPQHGSKRVRNAHKKMVEKFVADKRELERVRNAIIDVEQTINLLTFTYRNLELNFQMQWTDIKEVLSGNQAAIEFIPYIETSSGGWHYCALVIRSNSDNVRVIPLGSELQIRTHLRNLDMDSLYKVVWHPLERELKNVNEVYISASGIMNSIPFSALADKDKQLIDSYTLHNLLSTRDILAIKGRELSILPDNALFFGGADFGLSQREMTETTRGQGFDYLPGTKKEVETAALHLSNRGWSTTIHTDKLATKAELLQYMNKRSPSLLHIATHGFYLPRREMTASDLMMVETGKIDKAQFLFPENPLMRCGLLFSGANYAWSGKELADDADDGILTGGDISRLNLSNTELAVISACHTAIGGIDYTEGIYGIQRALKMAGAKMMIVSLWDIPDRESSEFMEEFYTRLASTKNVVMSFRKAQLIMRGKYSETPKKWAGFVLIE